MLSKEQQYIFEQYKLGKNIMMTGSAGCGKSYLIQQIAHDAKKSYNEKGMFQVTAMTGTAAVLLDCCAKTLHSWSGIGLGRLSIDRLIQKIKKDKQLFYRWTKIKLLIIDEVSMLSCHLFELLYHIACAIRKNNKPFGGIQIIFSGDFYQLPPIGKQNCLKSTQFCFESLLWKHTFDTKVIMTNHFRQTNQRFYLILEQIKKGKITKESFLTLRSRVDKLHDNKKGIKPVYLFPTQKMVHAMNLKKLDSLDAKSYHFKAKIHGHNKSYISEIDKMFNHSLYQKQLCLKIGCQVMCIVNLDIDKGICNGQTGIVVGFGDDSYPIVKLNNGKIHLFRPYTWKHETIKDLSIEQIPLVLSWAITIHKSQGITLDMAYIDAGPSMFEKGQMYVALSRVKSLDGLFLTNFKCSSIMPNYKVNQFIETCNTIH